MKTMAYHAAQMKLMKRNTTYGIAYLPITKADVINKLVTYEHPPATLIILTSPSHDHKITTLFANDIIRDNARVPCPDSLVNLNV